MTSVPPTQPPAAPESDEWPRPGFLGRVKCSDGVWRIAFCVLGRGGSPEWVFADGARRRVDTSTAHSVDASTGTDAYRVSLNLTTGDITTTPAHLPAASTGTSEDVEALAREVCPCSDDPDGTHVPDLDAGCGWALSLCRAVLASDWLAAHDAATADRVRREGAALVRDDIQARRREFRRLNADQQYLDALDDAYGLAANRAREQAR